jgi:hypothetical protein
MAVSGGTLHAISMPDRLDSFFDKSRRPSEIEPVVPSGE